MAITPASAWRQPNEEHTLPSGRVVELKRIDPVEIIMTGGNVPGSLTNFMARSMNGKPTNLNIAPEDMAFMPELAARVCVAAFANPRIVNEPDYEAGEIALSDVSFGDKIDVFQWAFQAGGQRQAAETFPSQQG